MKEEQANYPSRPQPLHQLNQQMIWEAMKIGMAVRQVANYNNNGRYNELTMHVWTTSWHLQPMIIQSNPVNQQ